MRTAVAFALLAFGCSSGGGGTHVLFQLHEASTPIATPTATDDFYALPFPNALRVRDDGTVNLDRYARVGGQIDDYIATIDKSPARFQNAGIFFRFDGAIDEATLPADPGASLADGATVFAVDLTTGERTPLKVHFTAINYDFIGPNWIAALPEPGFPFHEGHDIGVFVTDGVHGTDGKPVARAADLDAVLASATSSDAAVAHAQTVYAPLRTWLAAHTDVAKHVAGATYFSTGTSTKIMADLRAAVYAQVPTPPTLDGLVYDGEDTGAADDIFEGTYQGPNFQEGDPPYSSTGGAIASPPVVQRMETLRIALTVPKGDPPAAGWPVVIYQHGTGGDYMSFVGDGSGREVANVTDASGATISKMVMIGTDQVLHGPRAPAGTDVDTAFFNFLNLPAAHDNAKQGALDAFSVVRLIHGVNQTLPTTGKLLKFDVSKIYFKGHSQGGLTGPLFLSAEPEVKAAVLSGAGGALIESLLHKTEPVNIPQVVQALLHDPADEFHPLLSLIQGYFEDTDPLNYARLFFREPPSGFAAKSIFQTLGIIDHYTPIPSIEALALGMGVQPAGPQLQAIDGLALTQMQWGNAPITGNVAGGQATGVLLEYTAKAGSDGHFVVFDIPAAIAQSNRFLATHAATGTARLDPP